MSSEQSEENQINSCGKKLVTQKSIDAFLVNKKNTSRSTNPSKNYAEYVKNCQPYHEKQSKKRRLHELSCNTVKNTYADSDEELLTHNSGSKDSYQSKRFKDNKGNQIIPPFTIGEEKEEDDDEQSDS